MLFVLAIAALLSITVAYITVARRNVRTDQLKVNTDRMNGQLDQYSVH
jgi:hypothetical protein